MIRILPFALAALLLGCGTQLPTGGPGAVLPPDAIQGAGDPLRAAVNNTADAFASQRRLAGRPAEAARAVAQMEYLAAEVPTNPRFTTAGARVGTEMMNGKREWRGVLGIAPEAPPQPVINALYGAGRALDMGNTAAAAAALPPSIFTRGGEATIQLLANLPPMPATNRAAVATREMLENLQRQGLGRF